VPRLTHELSVTRGDGSLPRLLARWAKTDVLILDDWGLAPLATQDRHDLLEVIEERHAERSTIIAGQLPMKQCPSISATRPWPTRRSTASSMPRISSRCKENR